MCLRPLLSSLGATLVVVAATVAADADAAAAATAATNADAAAAAISMCQGGLVQVGGVWRWWSTCKS